MYCTKPIRVVTWSCGVIWLDHRKSHMFFPGEWNGRIDKWAELKKHYMSEVSINGLSTNHSRIDKLVIPSFSMSTYYSSIMPAHLPGNSGSGPTDVFYPRAEKVVDSGGFHGTSHPMCYDNDNPASYQMANYSCYPNMYDRFDPHSHVSNHNQIQPMNLVAKQQGLVHGTNGLYPHHPYSNPQSFNSQGLSSFGEDRQNCVKNDDGCIPTPPPNYPIHSEQGHANHGHLGIHGSEISHRMNGLSPAHAQNMQVFPWMGACTTINGGNYHALFMWFLPQFSFQTLFDQFTHYIRPARSSCVKVSYVYLSKWIILIKKIWPV